MELNFRPLRADEIECRVQTVKQNGLSVLLYKDARVDQRILDETVGPMNWQRHHSRDNANCIVSIWDDAKKQWIEKEDTGTESNTEAQKGLASDSFKRACFNWGIGRELYTSPFIWVNASECEIKPKGNGFTCYDRFSVKSIGIEDGKVASLQIVNEKTHRVVFSMGIQKAEYKKPETSDETSETDPSSVMITKAHWQALQKLAKRKGVSMMAVGRQYGFSKASEINMQLHNQIKDALEAMEDVAVE